jgi:UDP-N-acetylmuramoyl-L-alanyl-D-glutamate--2,6-diaminopimelate ligase
MNMSLRDLLDDPAAPDVVVSGLCEDSQAVIRGDAFVALRGEVADGHDFIRQAHSNGAVAALCEHLVDKSPLPIVQVSNLKVRRGQLAATLYGEPSRRLHCIGVTGTNGKTTIAHYIADLAGRLGKPSGYMGTIGWGAPGALEAARLTTESPLIIQQRLAKLVDDGRQWVAMEVSSHALDQGRVDEVAFDIAVFSNLTRDHLDYHTTEQAYFDAKARLFGYSSLATAVINLDDPMGREIAQGLSPGVQLLGYGRKADIRWDKLTYTADGIRGRWRTPWGDADLELPLAGEFSVANMAAVVGVLCASGLDFNKVIEAAAKVTPVPGRLEFFRVPQRPTVVVDYAHTPDALDKVLEALRHHTGGRLICVFGCGGDRDPGKRALMASAAERHADVLWLTSDNPRSEDPDGILDDMAAGLTGAVCSHRCVDRGEAIAAALDAAGPNDLLVVAGKGHEDYQEIAGERIDFSDRLVVADLLGATN